jgi:hypothetical protein
MQLKGIRVQRLRTVCVVLALSMAVVLAFHSLGQNDRSVEIAKGGLQAAEREQQAAAAQAQVVATRAAEARQQTKPVLARAELLHARVRVERSGLLRVQESAPAETTLVPVPPLVTDRIQADSVAISALSVALTWDSTAVAAQLQELAADADAEDAAHKTIAALERERKPRCGWRCGMLLGVTSVVALGIAVR